MFVVGKHKKINNPVKNVASLFLDKSNNDQCLKRSCIVVLYQTSKDVLEDSTSNTLKLMFTRCKDPLRGSIIWGIFGHGTYGRT